jgi:hypothetical protein
LNQRNIRSVSRKKGLSLLDQLRDSTKNLLGLALERSEVVPERIALLRIEGSVQDRKMLVDSKPTPIGNPEWPLPKNVLGQSEHGAALVEVGD